MKLSRQSFPRPWTRMMGLALLVCALLSGCGGASLPYSSEVALVANPTESAEASPEESASPSVSVAKTPTSSPSPIRQMLAVTPLPEDPERLALLERLAADRTEIADFPSYELLFAPLEPEQRRELLLLADKMLAEEPTGEASLPLEGEKNGVYFDAENGVYHIPQRNLSESERRALLSWEIQIDHVLLTSSLQRLAEEFGPNAESALVGQAVRMLQSTYNTNVSELEYYLRYYQEEEGEEYIWQVQFFHPNAYTLSNNGQPRDWYLLEFSEPTMTFSRMRRGFTDISETIGLPPVNSALAISEFTLESLRQDGFWAQDAWEIIDGIIQPDASIDEVYVQRFDGDDELILRVSMLDGSSYRLHYSVISRLPNEITFVDAHELPIPMDPLLAPLEGEEGEEGT